MVVPFNGDEKFCLVAKANFQKLTQHENVKRDGYQAKITDAEERARNSR